MALYYCVNVIQPGPRPPRHRIAEHLWGEHCIFDWAGNSETPEDTRWTELTLELCATRARVNIDHVSLEPLILNVCAESIHLALKVANLIVDYGGGKMVLVGCGEEEMENMGGAGNDTRKAELKQQWKEQEREALIASIPIPHEDLRSLLDHLDAHFDQDDEYCDHTLRITAAFLQQRGLAHETVLPWLREHGGYCDCEVLANVGGTFEDLI
jgi:hypothetical protein